MNLHNAEPHTLYSSLKLIRNLRKTYRVLVGISERKRPLGRPSYRWEDNIKMDLKEVGVILRTGLTLLKIGTNCGFPSLHLRHNSFSKPSELFLQAFRRFTYVTAHFPNLQNSLSKLSVASPTSQLIFQTFRTLSPSFPSLHLRHSSFPTLQNSFSKLSVALPTSQGLHLRHLASRPCEGFLEDFRAAFV